MKPRKTAKIGQKPVLDLGELGRIQRQRMQEIVDFHGLDVLQELKKPKYKPKFGPIAKNILDVRNINKPKSIAWASSSKWLLADPFRLFGEIISGKKGVRAYVRDSRQHKLADKLRKKYAPEVELAQKRFKKNLDAAYKWLAKAFAEGKINSKNRNSYLKAYKNAVKEAEIFFKHSCTVLGDAYAFEWAAKGRKAAKTGDIGFGNAKEKLSSEYQKRFRKVNDEIKRFEAEEAAG